MTAATNRRNRRAQARSRRRARVVRSASARQRRADTTTFTYSDPLFLTAVDGPSGRLATYVYDSESKRRRVYEGAAFTTIVWDGWDYLQCRRSSGTHVFHTINGEIVGESVGGTVRDYLLDPLGSVVATLDSDGLVDQFEYWPYGELVDDLPEGAPVFLWIGGLGYWFDTDERRYVRHRMLRTDFGSWMQLDPLWNRTAAYHYSHHAPHSSIDPTGLLPPRPLPTEPPVGSEGCGQGANSHLSWAQRLLCSEMYSGPSAVCVRNCATKYNVSLDCLHSFCRRGQIRQVHCPADGSVVPCPSCCSNSHVSMPRRCGFTNCGELALTICCNGTEEGIAAKCGCPSIRRIELPFSFNCFDVVGTFYHELAHVCGPKSHCNNEEVVGQVAEDFANCLMKCITPGVPPRL